MLFLKRPFALCANAAHSSMLWAVFHKRAEGSAGVAVGGKTSLNQALRIAAVHKGTSDPYLQWPTFNWTQTRSAKVDPWATLVDTSKNSGINLAPGKTARHKIPQTHNCEFGLRSNIGVRMGLLNAT